jgi:hypothetical protein
MKIKDVVIKEADFSTAYAMRNTQTLPVDTTKPGTGMAGSQGGRPAPAAAAPAPAAPAPAAAKPAAAKPAAPKKAAPASGKVPPQPTLNGKPSTGPKGQAWLQKYGATHNPDGTPKASVDQAAVPASANASSSYTGAPAAQPAAEPATPSAGTTAEIDRLKQLAIGGQQPAAQAAQPAAAEPVATANAGDNSGEWAAGRLPMSTTAPAPAQQNTAAPNSGSSYTGDIGTATNDAPAGQAAQSANVNPDTGASTVAPTVKTGTGGTLTSSDGKAVTSRSDDEIAWANANPANRFNPNGYPGPGNWDPRTGNKKTDPNAPGFFDKLFGKKQPAQGQAAQPAPAPAAGSMGTLTPDQLATINQNFGPKKEDISILRKLAGLK